MRQRKENVQVSIYILWVSAVFTVMVCLGTSLAKELPLLVELSDLGEVYDGKRITVFGWVKSTEVKTGRRGSLHLELIVGEGDHSVHVFTVRPVSHILNRRVIVQGIFHEHGRFAGHEKAHFIVAETIVRDWGESKKGDDS